MSDLSRLLDDVYGTAAPSWATETAEVFGGWVPEAAPDLRVVPDPVVALEAILDLGVAERSPAPEPDPEPEAAPAPEPVPLLTGRPWVPSDDDILPARTPRRRFTLRRR